jgi:purine-binding chemotaxis protein CheW
MKQQPGNRAGDWRTVRQRLEAAIAATEAAERLSPERVREVLDDRAAALARVPPAPLNAAETIELLTFNLGEERYAIETRFVREVQRQLEVTFVPGAPKFVRGVTNLRGEVLAVFDLGELFAIGDGGERRAWLIVLGVERLEFGIACDSVADVLTLSAGELRKSPAALHEGARRYARAVTAEALIVLDGEHLLSDPRLIVDQGDEPRA